MRTGTKDYVEIFISIIYNSQCHKGRSMKEESWMKTKLLFFFLYTNPPHFYCLLTTTRDWNHSIHTLINSSFIITVAFLT